MDLKKTSISALILLALFFLNSCSDQGKKLGISLDVKIRPDQLSDCLYAKFDYTIQTKDNFVKLKKDMTVFVHVYRLKTEEMLLQDDHKPVKASSTWNKNQKVSYSRILFIPKFINELDADFKGYEELKITVGLWDPADPESKPVNLFKKVVRIDPFSAKAPDIQYSSGWHDIEFDDSINREHEKSWRWTKKKAVCVIDNPKKDSTLIIRGGVDKNVYKDQEISISLNNKVLETFIPKTSKFSREYKIKSEMLGSEGEFTLTIESNKTFVPQTINASINDLRELGTQIYFLYFRETVK